MIILSYIIHCRLISGITQKYFIFGVTHNSHNLLRIVKVLSLKTHFWSIYMSYRVFYGNFVIFYIHIQCRIYFILFFYNIFLLDVVELYFIMSCYQNI